MANPRLIAGSKILETSITNDVDFYASNIGRSQAKANIPVRHTIQVAFREGGGIRLLWDDGASTNILKMLNNGATLQVDRLYVFDFIVPEGVTYNVQHTNASPQIVNMEIYESDEIEI